MDQGCGRNAPYPVLGLCDADGLRASPLQHAVQDLDGDVHLSRPTLLCARARSPSPITRLNRPMVASARARLLYPDAVCHAMRPRSAMS